MAVTTPLGVKRICPSCNARFYDLNKKPATCPKCAHSYDPTVQARPRRARRVAVESSLDNEDLLIQHMAKNKQPPKKKEKIEEDEIEGFDVEPAVEEELEDIEDIEQLEELEDIEETEEMDDDIALEDDAGLIDDVEDTESDDEESGDDEEEPRRARKKPAPAKKRKK